MEFLREAMTHPQQRNRYFSEKFRFLVAIFVVNCDLEDGMNVEHRSEISSKHESVNFSLPRYYPWRANSNCRREKIIEISCQIKLHQDLMALTKCVTTCRPTITT